MHFLYQLWKEREKEGNKRKDKSGSKESREEVPYMCEALSAKKFVWHCLAIKSVLTQLLVFSIHRVENALLTHKVSKTPKCTQSAKTCTVQGLKCIFLLGVLFLSFLLWSSLCLSFPFPLLPAFLFASFHSVRPSLLRCSLPWNLLSFVDQLLHYFVASLLSSVLLVAVCYFLYDMLPCCI